MTLARAVGTETQSGTGLFSIHDIVEFGERWAQYGGAPALDIMVTFGWTTSRYFTELRDILADGTPDGMSPSVATQMSDICHLRIWMGR